MNYLNSLSYFDDLREQNAKAFQLKELENADITDYLEYFFGEAPTGEDEATQQEQCVDTQVGVIKEEVEESTSQQRQRTSGGVVNEQESDVNTTDLLMNQYQSLDTSELDQEEIQKLKKRLEFIDMSDSRDNNAVIMGTGMTTPSIISQSNGNEKGKAKETVFSYEQKQEQMQLSIQQQVGRGDTRKDKQKYSKDSDLFKQMLVGECCE